MASLYIANVGTSPSVTGHGISSRGTWYATSSNYQFSYEAFVPGANINLDEIEILTNYYDGFSPPSNFVVALYADGPSSGSAPGPRLATLSGTSTPQEGVYNSYFAAQDIRLQKGVQYWLGFELSSTTGSTITRARLATNKGNFSLAPEWSAPVHREVQNGLITDNVTPLVYNLYGDDGFSVDRAAFGLPESGVGLIVSGKHALVQSFIKGENCVLSSSRIETDSGRDVISFAPAGYSAEARSLFVASAGRSVSGTVLLNGNSASYASSGSGDLAVTGVLTAGSTTTSLERVALALGAGADVVVFAKASAHFVAVDIEAGDGGDDIVFAQYFNQEAGVQVAASGSIDADIADSHIRAGSGDDRLFFASGSYDLSRITINGNAGQDRIILSAISGRIQSGSLWAGGKGDDWIDLDCSGAITQSTVAAGFGHDDCYLSALSISATLIAGDPVIELYATGADLIRLDVGKELNEVTVLAGAGSDELFVSASGGSSNVLFLEEGADTIIYSSTGGLTRSMLDAGAGNDSISFLKSVQSNQASAFMLVAGAGHDSIQFSFDDGNYLSHAFTGATVVAGPGADLVSGTLASGGIASQLAFAYHDFADSTAVGMDTITLLAASGTQINLALELDVQLSLASFAISAASATNGVVQFIDESIGSSLTQCLAVIDQASPQRGRIALFATTDNRHYLFVQGAYSEDLVVHIGAPSSTDLSRLTLSDGFMLGIAISGR